MNDSISSKKLKLLVNDCNNEETNTLLCKLSNRPGFQFNVMFDNNQNNNKGQKKVSDFSENEKVASKPDACPSQLTCLSQ